ncbi:type II toxin-antitoxin system prevent-host-death family antitoxin [Coraliomargarita sp. SDUM461003]|uniref:Type II toxin-antitoxin system prevent-host-death family antitoxin n=1 Tax=Thalassobacterium maritimum TaxID=3041265 RepID=A0ABU1AXX6_9BACT|nr:type II toxin-antitoxin system prevent-host-death family antitoxin [Coraliomargarita sp. SDUM461003]MDQ8208990.1 type II toxin-antitoxin system prevent-host-death family antitoxin [Coraliomargarita sp. SDUM461003]
MITANISKTKNELSRYLEAVRGGETVVILDRNRPIAQIQPLSSESGADLARLSELEAGGLITRPQSRDVAWIRHLQPVGDDPAGQVESVDALIEERESGR